MPVGIQRLNARKSQPNVHVVFIKPLKGPGEKVAQDFLERIAAQCLPVMRDNHLSVMTLEEFEPNREFVGRNFNAGEVIQLVLKSPGSGRWLPFEYVQMVMMHELAHCKQMNHSRAFWAVRNQYAAQMQGLWGKGYTGEGIWGRGASLGTGLWERDTVRADEVLPEHLCGGTYRSRRRKRKAKPTLTYQERKERRILKKFGKNGVALGADEGTKAGLEKGKRVQAKPRVAGSARGRELRAAAALARFEQHKTPEPSGLKKEEEDIETDSGSGSEYEEDPADAGSGDAVDLDGSRLRDGQGRGMVKVCEDEDVDDPEVKNELDELQGVFLNRRIKDESPGPSRPGPTRLMQERGAVLVKAEPDEPELARLPAGRSSVEAKPTALPSRIHDYLPGAAKSEDQGPAPSQVPPSQTSPSTAHIPGDGDGAAAACCVCSFANPAHAITCGMCANVLDPSTMPRSWRCDGEACKGGAYVNSGDCGVCGLCGRRRP